MNSHEKVAREITENWWHESWKHYGPDALNEAIATALRDTERNAKREVAREMMTVSDAMLETAGRLPSADQYDNWQEATADCFRAMLKQFASENGIDLEEVET